MALSKARTISRDDLIAGIAALPIGVVAGVTGVGGGEYRAPVLLSLLRNVRYTIAGNLLAGVLVGISTALLRGAFVQPLDTMLLAATMVVGSLPGAYGGAILARRTPSKWLKGLLAGILAITALRLLLFESPTPGSFAFGPEQALLGLGVGLGIGLISGLLGVAGGEYRIPALILIFGLPSIVAGTISSLVSLPQQLVGFWKHRQMGQATRKTLRLAVIMGVVGIAGVGLGVALLQRTTNATVTKILASLMLLAAAQIAWEIRSPDVAEESGTRPGSSSRDPEP
ncbi:MAG: sulfite exporter TauE/SafE family protein [Methanobacteriota archaeon]|nr:MAG: sulfite exporter TauE/SafE family protein [Euryarchaeota archaeon]